MERELYTPQQNNWIEDEERLADEALAINDAVMKAEKGVYGGIEDEPPDQEAVLVAAGLDQIFKWDEEEAKKLDAEMLKRQNITKSVKGDISKGYDLVRWRNIEGIAFFHCRDYIAPVTEERLALVKDITVVLKEMCEVFSYNAYYITLFYQPGSQSRFMQQKLLFNIAALEKWKNEKKLNKITDDEYIYLYFYGLMVHKMSHYHDGLHGSRHDFFQNEMRIEFMIDWLDYLESKGFDPEKIDLDETMIETTVGIAGIEHKSLADWTLRSVVF